MLLGTIAAVAVATSPALADPATVAPPYSGSPEVVVAPESTVPAPAEDTLPAPVEDTAPTPAPAEQPAPVDASPPPAEPTPVEQAPAEPAPVSQGIYMPPDTPVDAGSPPPDPSTPPTPVVVPVEIPIDVPAGPDALPGSSRTIVATVPASTRNETTASPVKDVADSSQVWTAPAVPVAPDAPVATEKPVGTEPPVAAPTIAQTVPPLTVVTNRGASEFTAITTLRAEETTATAPAKTRRPIMDVRPVAPVIGGGIETLVTLDFGYTPGYGSVGLLEVLAAYAFPGLSNTSTGAILLLFSFAVLAGALNPRLPRLHLRTVVTRNGAAAFGFHAVALRPG